MLEGRPILAEIVPQTGEARPLVRPEGRRKTGGAPAHLPEVVF